MKINFIKMHGLGNDFIVLDWRRGAPVKNIPALMKKLSHRRFGIGFDQALVLMKSKKADFRMDIYNNDGSRVEMCGNGIRALANYIWTRKLSAKKVLEIETLAGIIKPEKSGSLVRVNMGRPELEGLKIPTVLEGRIVDYPFKVNGATFRITCVSMGNPHCVIFVDDADSFDVQKWGPLIENNPFFPRRTNVEFIEVLGKKRLKMRVWERGAGETLACGTGACAAAVAAVINGKASRDVTLELRGGNLKIAWAKDDTVFMTGAAVEVFTGIVQF